MRPLYEAMSKALGEFTAPGTVVVTIFRNLGASYRDINKKIPRVFAEDVGLNPSEYGVNRDCGVYMATNVWNYLKHLEETGRLKVPLAKRGIHCFSDLIENKYHAQLFGGSLPGRKMGKRHSGCDDDDLSFDRAVKEYEK